CGEHVGNFHNAGLSNNYEEGAWYKCPNGHFYAIGECGGATQVTKCPECGADIGANLANYDLQNFTH
uniref:RZ-type domain-containing protein n=1 Tax=Amphimedon queenslandica TaxID=400682 RepID=A0A1X7ULC4_AMPQE